MGLHKSKESRPQLSATMWLMPAIFILLSVAFMAFGRFGAHIMTAAIFMAQIGFSSAYLLFLSHNLASIVKGYDNFANLSNTQIKANNFLSAG